MKLLIFILCIALSRSFPTLGGYETLDTQEAQADPNIQNFINIAKQVIVDDGIQKGQFSDSNFQLTKVNSIRKQQGEGNNYRFDCEFSNDEDYTIKANFDINYQESTGKTTVTEYTYKVQKSAIIQDLEGLYTQVTFAEFENSQELQDLAAYGINDMIKRCIQNKYLPDLNYKVSDVHWLYRQVYESAFFYKCNVDITDNDGTVQMNANFTVYYQPLLDNETLTDYSCVVKSEQYGNKEAYVTTATIAPTESDYSLIPESEVQNNDVIKQALDYGSQQIAEIAANDGKVPANTNLEIIKVDKAESQIVGNGVYYRFTCELGNDEGVVVTANMTVYYDPYSKENDLAYYSYECEIIEEQEEEEEHQGELLQGEDQGEFTEPEVEFINQEEPDIEEPSKPSSIFNQVFPLPEDEEEEDQPNEENIINVGNNQEEEEIFVWTPQGEEEILQPQEEEEDIITEIPPIDEEAIWQPDQEGESWEPSQEGGSWEQEESDMPPGYTEININKVSSDPQISSAFQYGGDQVTQKGKDDSKIPEGEYTVSQITEAYQKPSNNGVYYKFKCVANSDQGATLWLAYTVYQDSSSQENRLVSYSYRVRTGQTGTSSITPVISPQGNFVPCDEEEINSSQIIQGALDFGVSQIESKVAQEKDIPVSGYSLSQVLSVSKLQTIIGTTFKCTVVLEDDSRGSTIDANFTVFYNINSKQYSLEDYGYDVQEPENQSEPSAEEELILNEEEGGDEGYKDVDLEYLDWDDEYKDMLLYAINEIIQEGNDDGKIPKSEYKISNIDFVKKKPEDDGENYYKCSLELQDVTKVNIKIKIKFTASIKSATGYKKLWSYTYNINIKATITQTTQVPNNAYTTIDTDEVKYNTEIQDCINYGVEQIIPNPQDYSLSKINSLSRQIVGSAIYYKYNIELAGDKKTAQLSCTIYYKPDSDTKDVYAYSYKTQASSSSSSSSNSNFSWWNPSSSSSAPSFSWESSPDYTPISSYKYNKLDVSEVEDNPKYQDILDYGVKECVQDLADNKVIADTDYKVDEVLDAYAQENDDYENCKMKVKLSNSMGISINLDFNVQYQTNSEEKTITSYSAEGSSSDQSQVLLADYNAEDGGQLEVGNCDRVPNQEVDSTQYVKDAIDYGAQQVAKEVAEKEGYEDKNFEVKDVKNVYREVVNPSNYKVDATLENSKGDVIDCSYSVNYQPSTDTKKLGSYSYITY